MNTAHAIQILRYLKAGLNAYGEEFQHGDLDDFNFQHAIHLALENLETATRSLPKPIYNLTDEELTEYNRNNKNPLRHGAKWNWQEDAYLKNHYEEGINIGHLAKALQRSNWAIIKRLNQIKIITTHQEIALHIFYKTENTATKHS